MARGIIFVALGFFALVMARWGIVSLASFFPSPVTSSFSVIDPARFSLARQTSYLSQSYGKTAFSGHYPDGEHNGIDIAAPRGTPVGSAADGVALFTGDQDSFCPGRGYGKFVLVRNTSDGNVLLYAHLDHIAVREGEKNTRGALIGRVGATGFITAPHLHFSVFEGKTFSLEHKEGCGLMPAGKDIDPIPYLEAINIKAKVSS